MLARVGGGRLGERKVEGGCFATAEGEGVRMGIGKRGRGGGGGGG